MFFRTPRSAARQFQPVPCRQQVAAPAIGLLLLALSGCAIGDYAPPLLPTFMRPDVPAGVMPADPPPPAEARPAHLPPPGSLPSPTAPPRSAPSPPEVAKPTPTAEGIVQAVAKDADPVFELPPPRRDAPAGIGLDQAILATLRADPKLQAALENVNQANADLLTSSLPPNPTLTGDGIFLPLRRSTPDRPVGPPQTDYLLAYPIDWYLFGKRAAAIESARLGVDVSAADYADQVRQRVANVIAAFFDVLEARALLDLARQDLENLQRVETMTKERVKLGGVGAVEQDRARLAVFDAHREARNREVTLAGALSKLRAFLGPLGCDPALDVAGSLEVPLPAPPLTYAEALAIAEQVRPDVISLHRQVARAEAAIQAERTKGFPTVTPSLGFSEQFQHSLGAPDAPSWDVSVNVSIPVFDRNQGNVAKARSVEVQTALTLRSQLNDLRAEVEQAVDAFRVAAANVKANDPEQLKTARDVRDKIEAAYKAAGGRSLLEVLDAERAYRDAYRTYILSQSSYWHSLHKLNAAVGKQVLR
jgi:outer membrane protein, heavy metal efflux system